MGDLIVTSFSLLAKFVCLSSLWTTSVYFFCVGLPTCVVCVCGCVCVSAGLSYPSMYMFLGLFLWFCLIVWLYFTWQHIHMSVIVSLPDFFDFHAYVPLTNNVDTPRHVWNNMQTNVWTMTLPLRMQEGWLYWKVDGPTCVFRSRLCWLLIVPSVSSLLCLPLQFLTFWLWSRSTPPHCWITPPCWHHLLLASKPQLLCLHEKNIYIIIPLYVHHLHQPLHLHANSSPIWLFCSFKAFRT